MRLIDADALIGALHNYAFLEGDDRSICYNVIQRQPTIEPEPNYCRECKWSWCYIKVDKHGNSETYWWCLNWDGETDEEGYCHEWERREE